MKQNKKIKEVISEVNSRLSFYDPGFISLKRFSEASIDERERITNFPQFLECKINLEMSNNIPELDPYVQAFQGHLFVIDSIEDLEEDKYRFGLATVKITSDPSYFLGSPEEFPPVIERVRKIVGGDVIKFTSAPKRMKLIIE